MLQGLPILAAECLLMQNWNRTKVEDGKRGCHQGKCQIYQAVFLPTLLYNAETWALYSAQVRKLDTFVIKHLRCIMGVRRYYIREKNTDILEKATDAEIFEFDR